jgi:DNA-binding CsgD family transcriptional regulator
VREALPAYERALQRPDPRMRGELAAWLFRAGALHEQPSDIAAAYALEIAGDWSAAARTWQELGCPYEYASLLAWHGTEFEQRQALAIFDELGANPAAQALRRQMRAGGVRRVPRGSRLSTQLHPQGLTRREAQILELVSQGLRNAAIAKRLFLSTKTVEHHVSAILKKLGVSSRAKIISRATPRPGPRDSSPPAHGQRP